MHFIFNKKRTKIINADIYAVLSLTKKLQFTHFLCVKFLAQKSGRVKFLTNFKSGASLLLTNEKAVFCDK